MRPFLVLLFVMSLAGALQADERPQPEFTMTAPGTLEIGPDGRVRTWRMDSHKLGDGVEALLQKNIEQWRFEPVRVEGRPVIAQTRMTVELTALPRPDGYAFKVSEVHFGSGKPRGAFKPPKYPADAVRAHLGARVLLAVRLDEQGNVVAVHPYQTSLSKGGRERQAERWRKRFEQASIHAVSQWKYEPGESIGGRPVGSTIMVPIVFAITDGPHRGLDNRWIGYVPGPITPAPWTDGSSMARVDLDGLGEGDSVGIDSPFRLASDVVGKAL